MRGAEIMRTLLAMLLLSAACASVPPTHDIPNFDQVDPGVYRGGQPTAAGWAWLQSQGVTIDVKLNYQPENAPAGMTVVVASMPPEGLADAEKRPDASAVGLAVHALSRSELGIGKVFVHCDHGQDRTGLIVGLYRVFRDHWTRAAAHREMLAHGFHELFLGLDAVWEDWTRE